MDTNNQSVMVEGANPDMLWMQHIDYLATQSKIMKKEYIRRKRANKPFTWNDLDVMNKKIHHDLDVVMSGVENVQENKQNTNMNKKLIRLNESDLHRIVKESVKRVLKEEMENTGLRKCDPDERDWFRMYGYRAADGWYGKWLGNDVMQFCNPRFSEITDPIKGEKCIIKVDGEDIETMKWKMPNGIPSQYECDIDFDN